MIDDIQREVAVHLLANALRRRRIAQGHRGVESGGSAALAGRGRNLDDEYLRGLLDMLRALHGPARADALYRQALALEDANAS